MRARTPAYPSGRGISPPGLPAPSVATWATLGGAGRPRRGSRLRPPPSVARWALRQHLGRRGDARRWGLRRPPCRSSADPMPPAWDSPGSPDCRVARTYRRWHDRHPAPRCSGPHRRDRSPRRLRHRRCAWRTPVPRPARSPTPARRSGRPSVPPLRRDPLDPGYSCRARSSASSPPAKVVAVGAAPVDAVTGIDVMAVAADLDHKRRRRPGASGVRPHHGRMPHAQRRGRHPSRRRHTKLTDGQRLDLWHGLRTPMFASTSTTHRDTSE